MYLSNSEKTSLLETLAKLSGTLGRMSEILSSIETQPCVQCAHFLLEDQCDYWQSKVPLAAQPEGCTHWEKKRPIGSLSSDDIPF